jgi:hypothetical protein
MQLSRLLAAACAAVVAALGLTVVASPANAAPGEFYLQTVGPSWSGGKFLDGMNNSGTGLGLWTPYAGEYTQRFKGVNGAIVHVASGKCIDESAARNGATVYLAPCHYRNNQKWTFGVPDTGPGYWLVSWQDGRCLDIRDYARTNGAPVQVWDCTNAWNQRWLQVWV